MQSQNTAQVNYKLYTLKDLITTFIEIRVCCYKVNGMIQMRTKGDKNLLRKSETYDNIP